MKYRKKPEIIEAIQWNGENREEVERFVGKELKYDCSTNGLIIDVINGTMWANKGDMIIKKADGECYPCKLYIFNLFCEKA